MQTNELTPKSNPKNCSQAVFAVILIVEIVILQLRTSTCASSSSQAIASVYQYGSACE